MPVNVNAFLEPDREKQARDTFAANNNGSSDAGGIAVQRRIFEEHAARRAAPVQGSGPIVGSYEDSLNNIYQLARQSADTRRNNAQQDSAMQMLVQMLGGMGAGGSHRTGSSGGGSFGGNTGNPILDTFHKNLQLLYKQGDNKVGGVDADAAHKDATMMTKRQLELVAPADDIAGTSSRIDRGGGGQTDWRDSAQQQLVKVLMDRMAGNGGGTDFSKPVGFGQAMFPTAGQGPSILGAQNYRANNINNLQPALPSSNASVVPLSPPGVAAVAPSFAQPGVVPDSQISKSLGALSPVPDSQLPQPQRPLFGAGSTPVTGSGMQDITGDFSAYQSKNRTPFASPSGVDSLGLPATAPGSNVVGGAASSLGQFVSSGLKDSINLWGSGLN